MNKISNDNAWFKIFEHYRILDHLQINGFFDISADQIKAVDGKEARLMTKIDHKEHLPSVMKVHGLSILAIKNGLYRIAKTHPFIDIAPTPLTAVTYVEPPNIVSIDPFKIKSESAALDIAALSGMLKEVFEEDTQLTIRGRLRGSLAFMINGVDYGVEGVQIEVDGGYEGARSLHLVEAKIGYRNNMNIRQLLYPELFWKQQVDNSKEVKSYIFYYQEGLFRFIPCYYENEQYVAQHYQEKVFKFKTDTHFSLNQLTYPTTLLVNNSAPFPQANDFGRVYSLFTEIATQECYEMDELFLTFDLVHRQFKYYLDALKWLNLCTVEKDCVKLTPLGEKFLTLDLHERMVEVAKIVFSEPIFFKILKKEPVETELVIKWSLGPITFQRRVGTVKAWIHYFEKFFDRGLFDC